MISFWHGPIRPCQKLKDSYPETFEVNSIIHPHTSTHQQPLELHAFPTQWSLIQSCCSPMHLSSLYPAVSPSSLRLRNQFHHERDVSFPAASWLAFCLIHWKGVDQEILSRWGGAPKVTLIKSYYRYAFPAQCQHSLLNVILTFVFRSRYQDRSK